MPLIFLGVSTVYNNMALHLTNQTVFQYIEVTKL
jgi:hypothetical protein